MLVSELLCMKAGTAVSAAIQRIATLMNLIVSPLLLALRLFLARHEDPVTWLQIRAATGAPVNLGSYRSSSVRLQYLRFCFVICRIAGPSW